MEEIYKKYSKPVYRYLFSLTRNHELSEELMQETFYSAIKGIKKFRGECSIYSWLCEIAKNKWKNYQIKNSKLKTVEFDDEIENLLISDNVEDSICSQVEDAQFYKNIKNLDDLTKELLYLRINGGLSFKEISQILDKTETWARVTFYRAKSKLKERFNDEKRL